MEIRRVGRVLRNEKFGMKLLDEALSLLKVSKGAKFVVRRAGLGMINIKLFRYEHSTWKLLHLQ